MSETSFPDGYTLRQHKIPEFQGLEAFAGGGRPFSARRDHFISGAEADEDGVLATGRHACAAHAGKRCTRTSRLPQSAFCARGAGRSCTAPTAEGSAAAMNMRHRAPDKKGVTMTPWQPLLIGAALLAWRAPVLLKQPGPPCQSLTASGVVAQLRASSRRAALPVWWSGLR